MKSKCERCEHEADLLYKILYGKAMDWDLICLKCFDELQARAEAYAEMLLEDR